MLFSNGCLNKRTITFLVVQMKPKLLLPEDKLNYTKKTIAKTKKEKCIFSCTS